jgi:hypothetical protein
MAKLRTLETSTKSPPRIGPGSELTLKVSLPTQCSSGWIGVDTNQASAIENIELQGQNCEYKVYGTDRKLLRFTGAMLECLELIISFASSIEKLKTLHENGLKLEIYTGETQPEAHSTPAYYIYQPVVVEGLEPIPTVLSRKDSVPTQYTRNIERFAEIRKKCEALKFENYKNRVNDLLCVGVEEGNFLLTRTNQYLTGRSLPFTGDDSYRVLKAATEAFLLDEGVADFERAGVNLSEASRIGAVNVGAAAASDYDREKGVRYFQLVYQRLPNEQLKSHVFPRWNKESQQISQGPTKPSENDSCFGLLQDRMRRPLMVELIWSYWHEQAMLAQTMYAIRNRVQNVSENAAGDPLAHLEIGPLRPLNTLLWTYIQDEQHRLTVSRRNFEYEHQYGLSLRGKALRALQPVDRRSRFLEAFHNLLYLASVYFKEDDDTNRKADAFPVLHALKEVHFLLSEGAHNQFGELPVTSRIEMMMEQWLLSRPEFQRFLPTRESIAYPEGWMGSVDAMKTLQGWTSTSVMFYTDLARFGEMLLLSIRYEAWSEIIDRDMAANWAKMFRNEIQGYTHAYRIVTGVDLQHDGSATAAEDRRRDPAVLIQQRWEEQRREGNARSSQIRVAGAPTAGVPPIVRRGKA